MILDPDLNAVLSGDADLKAARLAIGRCLAADDAAARRDLYAALKGWTWKTLQLRRFDDELEPWFHVIRSTENRVARTDPTAAARFGALSDLVYDSILYGQANRDADLLRLNHVGEILDAIRQQNGRAGRKQIRERTGLGEAHLSRRLMALVLRGILGREQIGREAFYELTNAGAELADKWASKRRALARRADRVEFETPSPPPPAPAVAETEGWTAERVTVLKNLWLGGLSASEIARTLGGISRADVLGKARTLGLSGAITTDEGSSDEARSRQLEVLRRLRHEPADIVKLSAIRQVPPEPEATRDVAAIAPHEVKVQTASFTAAPGGASTAYRDGKGYSPAIAND